MFCKVLVGNIPVTFPSTSVVGSQGNTPQASPLKGLPLPKALAAVPRGCDRWEALGLSAAHRPCLPGILQCPLPSRLYCLAHRSVRGKSTSHPARYAACASLPWPPSSRMAPAPHVFSRSRSGSYALSWGNRESFLFLLLKCIFTCKILVSVVLSSFQFSRETP